MNFRNLDLNLLRVLDALFSEGSTVAAGQKIGLSQPAVSAALNRLRRSLDDPLFVRVGAGLVPTDYARSISAPVAATLDALETALEPPRFDPKTANTDFTLTSNDFFCSILMPRLSKITSIEAPNIRTQMVEGWPDSYSREVEDGDADIMLTPGALIPQTLEKELLFAARSVVVARKDNSRLITAGIGPNTDLPLDLFCDLQQVLYSPQGGFSGIADDILSRMGRSRRVAMSVNTFSGVMDTVAGSDLIGIVPEPYADDQAEGRGVVAYALPFDMTPMQMFMAWHPRSTNTPGHIWLRAKIRQALSGFAQPKAA